MTVAQASPDLRFMIRDRAASGGGGDPLDLQNIITDNLPNGAVCYVNQQRAAYVLDKYSDASADLSSVFAPIAGPGRWLLLTVAAGLVPPVMAYNTSSNTPAFACTGAYVQSSSSSFAAGELGSLERWALTASGCILTYTGPTVPMLATLTASVSVTDGTPAVPISAFVSLNDETPSVAAGGSDGQALVVCGVDGTNWVQLVSQRIFTAIPTGSTLRPKFAAGSGGAAGAIGSMQLVVRPL